MKGVVFTEFMEMVEQTFSMEVAEQIIETANLPSGGAYTSVGNYDHEEILSLVTQLAQSTEIPVVDLIHAFAQHLFVTFSTMHPEFFAEIDDAFGLLRLVDAHIHVEVHKLYPDAKLPRFVITERQDDGHRQLQMDYRSPRPFGVLAHGLILAALKHWNHDQATVLTEDHSVEGEYRTTFTISEPC